jgi:hypothetical protein
MVCFGPGPRSPRCHRIGSGLKTGTRQPMARRPPLAESCL